MLEQLSNRDLSEIEVKLSAMNKLSMSLESLWRNCAGD